MFSQYLQSMTGVEGFGVLSLLLSVVLFTGIVIWAVKKDKVYIRRMKRLPLESGDGATDRPARSAS